MPPSNSVLLSDFVLERLPFLRNANTRFFDFGNVQILDHSTAGETTKVMGKSAFSAVVVITDEVIALASFPMNAQSNSITGGNNNNNNNLTSPRSGNNNNTNNNNNNSSSSGLAAPIVIPHTSIVGVAREGSSVLVRNSFMNDIKLTLPKTEAFIVHLIGIQDRGMNRTLRLAGGEAGNMSSSNNINSNFISGGDDNNQNGSMIIDRNNTNDNNSNNKNNSSSQQQKQVTFGNFPLGMNIAQQDPSDPNAVRRAMSLAEDLSHGSAAAEASMERLWGVIRLGRGSSRAGPPTTELDEGSDASSVQTIQHIADSPREHDDDDDDFDQNLNHSDEHNEDHNEFYGSSKNDRAKAISREEVQVPPMVTDAASLKRRLWYFFMYYDQSRLQYIDTLVAMHQGTDGKALMKDLEQQYGPEPHRFRWSIRDQTMYQREINSQLRAQLARAQDELLLLKENPHEKESAVERVLRRKQEIMNKMMLESPTRSGSTTSNNNTMMTSPNHKNVSFSPDTKKDDGRKGNNNNNNENNNNNSPSSNGNNNGASWNEMFSNSNTSAAERRALLKGSYHILSFHDVSDDTNSYRPQFEWTVIVVSAFWPVVKQQVAGGGGRGGLSGPLRSTRPLIEITNEDCREMLVCNRDFFLAWLAESHGDCVMHVRHVDGSFCFMSLTESFRNVKLGI